MVIYKYINYYIRKKYIKSYINIYHQTPPNKIMLEKEIEAKLVKQVKDIGGLCWKFTSPGTVGVPDRICLLAHGKVAFVELKAQGMTLRPIQVKRKKQLEALGFKVFVVDSCEKIQEVLDEIRTT